MPGGDDEAWEWAGLREAGPVGVGIAAGPEMVAGSEVEGEKANGLEETVGPKARRRWQREGEAGIGLGEKLGPEGRIGWGGEVGGLSCES